MADSVASRLRGAGRLGRTIGIKVRFGDFRTISRSSNLATDTDSAREITGVARTLLGSIDPSPGIRLLGVVASQLVVAGDAASEQLTFDDLLGADTNAGPSSAGVTPGWQRAEAAVDEIRSRFGARAVGPASLAGRDGLRVARRGDQQWGLGTRRARPGTTIPTAEIARRPRCWRSDPVRDWRRPGDRPGDPARCVVPLSEDEQRILQEIEQQFYASDPDLAGEIGNHSLYAHCVRQMKWAGVLFGVGVVVLVVALATATNFLVAFAGFVVMLGAALWFERSLRKLGRAGMERLGESFRSTGGVRRVLRVPRPGRRPGRRGLTGSGQARPNASRSESRRRHRSNRLRSVSSGGAHLVAEGSRPGHVGHR